MWQTYAACQDSLHQQDPVREGAWKFVCCDCRRVGRRTRPRRSVATELKHRLRMIDMAISGEEVAVWGDDPMCYSGNSIEPETMLQLASGIEGHPDNVCPAIYGGIQIGVDITAADGPQRYTAHAGCCSEIRVLIIGGDRATCHIHAHCSWWRSFQIRQGSHPSCAHAWTTRFVMLEGACSC